MALLQEVLGTTTDVVLEFWVSPRVSHSRGETCQVCDFCRVVCVLAFGGLAGNYRLSFSFPHKACNRPMHVFWLYSED